MSIRAIITAIGATYLEEAIIASKGLRHNGNIQQITIYTDQDARQDLANVAEIARLDDTQQTTDLVNKWRQEGTLYNCKALALRRELERCPVSEKAFLLQIDSDTYTVADLTHLQIEASTYDMAISYECENDTIEVEPRKWHSTGLLRIESLDQINSGFVLFNLRSHIGRQCLDEWIESLLSPEASSVPEHCRWNDQASLQYIINSKGTSLRIKRLPNMEYNCFDRIWYETRMTENWSKIRVLHSSIIRQHYSAELERLDRLDWSIVEGNKEVYSYVSRYKILGGYASSTRQEACRLEMKRQPLLHTSEALEKTFEDNLPTKKEKEEQSHSSANAIKATHISAKPRLAVYGNCQSSQIASIIDYKQAAYVEHLIPCHLATQKDIDYTLDIAQKIDYMLLQPISTGYRQLKGAGSQEIAERAKSSLIIPNLFSRTEHPFLVDSTRVTDRFTLSYFDYYLYLCSRHNLGVNQVTALLETAGIQRLILDIAVRSMTELTKRSCSWEIRGAQDILNAVFSNSSQCFYSINHPSPFLLELVCDCICDTLGLLKTRLDEKSLFDACHPKICENYIFYWNASRLVLNDNRVPPNLSSPDMPYMIELRGGRL